MPDELPRVSFRTDLEADRWNAYFQTVDGESFLGCLRLGLVTANPERRDKFIELMRGIVQDFIKEQGK